MESHRVVSQQFEVDATTAIATDHPSIRVPQERVLTSCCKLLLGAANKKEGIQEALENIISGFDCDHAVLLRIESYHAEDFRGRRLACASQGTCGTCQENREWEYLRLINVRIREELEAGHSCRVNLDQQPPEFQKTFADRGIEGLLILPLIVLGKWWGGLCLESKLKNIPWEDETLCDLEAVASVISAYYERGDLSEGDQERDKLSGALEMAGTVCHKLNQPMQVILGYASMVTSGDISDIEQIKEVVQLIEDETRQMGIITKNLMGITKNLGAE